MRVRRLMISPELLVFMTSGKFEVIANGSPDDARISQTTIDPVTGDICLFVESKQFENLPSGAIPPIMEPPQIRRWMES